MKELPIHVAIVPDGVNPGLDGYVAIGNYDHEVSKDELGNPVIKADSLTITSVIAATPEPVDLRLTGGKLTYLFNQYGYASLVGISYREIK